MRPERDADPDVDPDAAGARETAARRAALARPLPRRALGRGTLALLVLLRLYVLVAVPLVVWAFLRALLHPGA